jgi:peptidoglycan/xylan/chitin deacetylase (PgdA/CDA1 family)
MKPVVLMYHDIVTVDDKSSGFQNESAFQYKVEETAFEEQIKALQGKDVVFTFDDGGVSFLTKAAPILEKYGFKGVFFISTKYIGTPGFLTAEQVKALEERGHVVGSHSHTHPEIFTKLSKEEIHEEWLKSFETLQSILGTKDLPMSIPNGYASKTIMQEAINCGYSDIYTSQPTTKVKTFQKHNVIGRYVVHENMSTQDVLRIVTSKGTKMKMAMKWHVLNIVKGLLGSSYDTLKAKVLHH